MGTRRRGSLFGSKPILRGSADANTIEAVSLALGEYDRQVTSTTERRPRDRLFVKESSQTVSTQRQRVLSSVEVANLPAGHALHLDRVVWELLTTTPAYATQPWRSVTGLPESTS